PEPARPVLDALSLHDALPICAVELLGEFVTGLGEVEAELLEPARHPDGPRGVAEEALDLADDGRHRESGKLHTARHLEAVDRLRSEEHTSELQSRENLVCRLL